MGLFERKRFVWNEPWFFQQRIRTIPAIACCSKVQAQIRLLAAAVDSQKLA
jgi:hypothetical protein